MNLGIYGRTFQVVKCRALEMIVSVSALKAKSGCITPSVRDTLSTSCIENIEDRDEYKFATALWSAALDKCKPCSQRIRDAIGMIAKVPSTGPFSCFDCDGSNTDEKTRSYVHNSRWCMAGNKQTGRVDSVNIVYTRSSRILNACVGRIVLVANSTYGTMRQWVIDAVENGDLIRVFLYHGGEDMIVDRGVHRVIAANSDWVMLYRVDVYPVPKWLTPVSAPPRVLYYGKNLEPALLSTDDRPFAPPPDPDGDLSMLSTTELQGTCFFASEEQGTGYASTIVPDTPASAGTEKSSCMKRVRFSNEIPTTPATDAASSDPIMASTWSGSESLVPTPKRARHIPTSPFSPRRAGSCSVATRPVIPRYALRDPFAIFALARDERWRKGITDADLDSLGVAVCARTSRSPVPGVHFDSRHEMRWSVFMSSLGIQHLREFATFTFDECRYTPDFYMLNGGLDGNHTWLEIKPCAPTIDAMQKCRALSERGCTVALLYGKPGLPFAYEGEDNQYAASECARCLIWTAGKDDFEKGIGVFAVDETKPRPEEQVCIRLVTTDADAVQWDHIWIRNAIVISYFVVP